jgi:hypothetical protein
VAVFVVLTALHGCGPSKETDRIANPGPVSIPFAVSDYFSPSGDMGDGEHAGYVTTDIDEHCIERPDGARGDCYRFTYSTHSPSDLLWAGVYWAYPANNWGTRPGRRIDAGSPNGPVLPQVSFYAASDQDMLPLTFFVGGIQYPTQLTGYPYQDKFQEHLSVNTTAQYQKYTIPLTPGDPYDSVIGGFGWVYGYPSGSDPLSLEPVVIYVDDIVWEWPPPVAADAGAE